MSDSLTIGTPLHGPGGLLGTAGLGARRKGRKWGMRTKDYSAHAGGVIQGNLGRSNSGQFTRVGTPSADAPPSFGKGAKKPRKGRAGGKGKGRASAKQTPEQHAQATAAKRQQNASDVAKRMADSDTGLSPSGSAGLLAFASGTPPSKEIAAGLAQMGLAEQASDGSYRMTPTGHATVSAMQSGDYQRAVDAISRGSDASGKRTQRQQERATRQQAAADRKKQVEARRAAVAARRAGKKPSKGSASGGDIASAVQGIGQQATAKRKKKGPSKITRDRAAENNRAANLARLSPTAQRALGAPVKERTKAQTDQEKAMFANMGGGGSGGSGGGKKAGGGSKLWPKGPSGKRTPQAAAAESRASGGGAKPAGNALPQDLRKMTPAQHRDTVDKLSQLPLDKLRERQQLNRQQMQQAYADHQAHGASTANERGMSNLQIRDQHITAAIDKKVFGGDTPPKTKDPHAPTKADRAVADRVRANSERENALTDKMTALRKEHDALTPSWGQKLQPKYEKERQAKQAVLMDQIHRASEERRAVQQHAQELLSNPEGRAALDRVVRQEIIARGRAGKPMPGDDVTLRMIEEQHGIRAPQIPAGHSAPQPITHNPDRARAAHTEYQGRQNEARGLRRQAQQADIDADRVEANSPELARSLRMSAADNKWKAFGLESGPRSMDLLKEIEASGYRLNATGRGLAKVTQVSTTPKMKAFAVFKDASGAHRWIARTTTAYRDRDGEIISEAALDADSQRMMASKQFGPLRYWHIGQPDPLSDAAPWGPGVDIGTCDYSVVIGRTRIESGTFHSAAIARKMAAVADDHEMSPGFLYTPDQPDADGVFTRIRTFERSPVPRRYARAANLFTGFAVKEHTMELPEMERRFKAMYQELGLTPEQGIELGQQLLATEKAAQQQGVAFKESSAPDEITINGVVYAVKAAAPPMQMPPMNAPDAEDDPALGGDGGVDEAAEGEPPMDAAPEGDYIGDMSPEDFKAMLAELLAPVLKMQDMVKSIGDAHAELKGMYGGVAQKEQGTHAEIAALKARLAQIEGDQPAVVLPDEVSAALKSAGPAVSDPEAAEITNDPTRPFAQIAARTMPALYKTGPAGEFAGWTPPPVQP